MKKPKILFYDIENSPMLSYTWGSYQQDVIDIKENWELLSVAYKWADEKEIHCITRQGESSDKNLTKKLWALFDEADILVAHNGNSFDVKKSTAKFIEHGLKPPSPYQTIDTKQIAKRHFRFENNSLNSLGKLLKVGVKAQTGGFSLWLGCMSNDPKAWEKMIRYNKQDVKLLEQVYLKLRPWTAKHPNLSVHGNQQCPKCQSKNVHKRGFDTTKAGIYQRYQCKDCGGWSRDRLPVKQTKKHVLVNG